MGASAPKRRKNKVITDECLMKLWQRYDDCRIDIPAFLKTAEMKLPSSPSEKSQTVHVSSPILDWIESLDKRPTDRTGEDLDKIFSKLKDVKAFEKFHPLLIQQLCYYSYYENLEKGVTLFRTGDYGSNWFAILAGYVDVVVPSENGKGHTLICTLGSGAAFGESILYDMPRNATVITTAFCELLRVEQKDFKILWERNKQYMHGVITSLSRLTNTLDPKRRASEFDPSLLPQVGSSKFFRDDPSRNPALPIVPQMIRDRKYHLKMHRSCLVGSEMVDWLIHQSPIVHSRSQAVGMWQALLEESAIQHVSQEHYFKDKYLFYRFSGDEDGIDSQSINVDNPECEEQLHEVIMILTQVAPDAMLRMILRKPPHERTVDDLEIIYDELIHVKALSHLSSLVKRELAGVLVFEAHPFQSEVLFSQGDEGKSWYIILKGSVNVVIYGKGVVCTLHEGDDFGKLSLVNNSPRTATIVLNEDNCHFLRVDKDDFNRILRDVEANTIRLKEHGKDVLVLEKIPINMKTIDGNYQVCYKYSVMAGSAEKMLEYLLETRICVNCEEGDTFLDDFLFTHIVFMPVNQLCATLLTIFKAKPHQRSGERMDLSLHEKVKVIRFVLEWHNIAGEAFYEDTKINTFLEELHRVIRIDAKIYPQLRDELKSIEAIMENDPDNRESKRTKLSWKQRSSIDKLKMIRGSDEVIFKVYCADHTYTTLKMTVDTLASKIVRLAADKLGLRSDLPDDLKLCEVKSTGERIVFKESDLSISHGLSLNGRLFLAPSDHLDALVPLPEQEGPSRGTWQKLEMFSSKELAYVMTLYDYELFNAIHQVNKLKFIICCCCFFRFCKQINFGLTFFLKYELIYQVFGRYKYGKITANLDVFMRRFNEVQYWIVTEVCLTTSLGKRVQLLRKFIKLASYCKEYRNLHSFFAVVMGLSNIAVSRLSLTWEKLPNKIKRMFSEFEALMDPSRNHRTYRSSLTKLTPPIILFMPLLLKEIQLPQGMKNTQEIQEYIRELSVIDNQRILNQLSNKLEPRQT
ncbi:unnamed protein product [Didymodactylos carnosus]|uniref:Rap guanine nucleotide exchange factor 4 n=1 Tax=Didymodactylos carnosus TaxID=1234261 RepID=A0A813ZAG2_9BILA|nr:unnamed protein product [Didymodactylos carnosus]CAF0897215.1 unnamed protein product [Didymodactylos carnosus]CAF3676517.1 unnamed protein product [Didymodactylos carnosus]CAF3680278.1 unnamed protein product [Didymodactylos carnosus]